MMTMTTMIALPVEDLKTSFTFQQFTPEKGELSYNTIVCLKIETICNDAGVKS